jgi:hypothetical protein
LGSPVPYLEKVFRHFFSLLLVPDDRGVPRRTHKHGDRRLPFLSLASFFLFFSTPSITMPVATVKDGLLSFSYEDSGPLPMRDEPYTTLVMVHGTGFHSGKQAS